MEKKGIKTAVQNRKAFHDYFVEETYECGISLAGTEVKSLRAGTANLKDSYCSIKDGEIFETVLNSDYIAWLDTDQSGKNAIEIFHR